MRSRAEGYLGPGRRRDASLCVPPFSTDVRCTPESNPLSVTDKPLSSGLSRVQSDSYRVCGLAPYMVGWSYGKEGTVMRRARATQSPSDCSHGGSAPALAGQGASSPISGPPPCPARKRDEDALAPTSRSLLGVLGEPLQRDVNIGLPLARDAVNGHLAPLNPLDTRWLSGRERTWEMRVFTQ